MADKDDKPAAAQLIKGKCDLCSKPDGYGGHNLQKCKDCGLLGKKNFSIRCDLFVGDWRSGLTSWNIYKLNSA